MTFQERYNQLDKNNNIKKYKKADPRAKKEIKNVFQKLASRENLDVNLAHADIGMDNSFFITKQEANKLIAHVASGNATEFDKRLVEILQKSQKKNKGKDGTVIIGTGENFGNSPEILSHEMGHVANHKESPWLIKGRNPLIGFTGGVLGGTLAAHGQFAPGLAVALAANTPILYDEGKASLRGYQNLKKLGHEPKVSPLAKGFGSYALGAVAPIGIGSLIYTKNNL